jgi:hypothetical protein
MSLDPKLDAYFPLELSPMERFMLWTDSPSRPKVFRVTLCFLGLLNRERLEMSCRIALGRHPLLAAKVTGGLGKETWTLDPEQEFSNAKCQVANRSFESDVTRDGLERIDLQKQAGFRYWLTEGGYEGGEEITVEFHHACCDGLGAQQFMSDWLSIYHQLTEGYSPSSLVLSPCDLDALVDRGKFERSKDAKGLSVWKKFLLAYRFHALLPKPIRGLAHPSASHQAGEVREHLMRFTLSNESAAQIDRDLQDTRMSLHDELSSRMLCFLSKWQTDRGLSSSTRLRLMIATDHRTRSQWRATALNRIGFAFVSSDCRTCQTVSSARHEAASQLAAIKFHKLGLDFVEPLALVARWPRLSLPILRLQRCWTSVVFTYMGDVDLRLSRVLPKESNGIRVGDVVLATIFGVPPIQNQTNVGLGVCRFGNRVRIGLRLYGDETFAQEFASQWQAFLER